MVLRTGISQSPSVGFRIPSKMMSSFLTATSYVLFKNTSQLSSHNCPMDISEALFKLGRIMAVDARSVRHECNGRVPALVEDIFSPFGRRTDEPRLSRMLERTRKS